MLDIPNKYTGVIKIIYYGKFAATNLAGDRPGLSGGTLILFVLFLKMAADGSHELLIFFRQFTAQQENFLFKFGIKNLTGINAKRQIRTADQLIDGDVEIFGKSHQQGDIRFSCSRFIVADSGLGGAEQFGQFGLCQPLRLPQFAKIISMIHDPTLSPP